MSRRWAVGPRVEKGEQNAARMITPSDIETVIDPLSSEKRTAAMLADELSLLIDGATNYAIYMLDPNGHVTIWNRGAERMKGSVHRTDPDIR